MEVVSVFKNDSLTSTNQVKPCCLEYVLLACNVKRTQFFACREHFPKKWDCKRAFRTCQLMLPKSNFGDEFEPQNMYKNAKSIKTGCNSNHIDQSLQH